MGEGEKVGDEMETDAEKADAEAGNLEQAWQMFDLAKVIYGKAGDVAKECESLTFLGEVSLENSNFKQAVEDLTLCLTKRIKALADLTLLCTEIKERSSDHKEMQKGTYKDENDFVSIFKGAEVHEIGTKKAVATAWSPAPYANLLP